MNGSTRRHAALCALALSGAALLAMPSQALEPAGNTERSAGERPVNERSAGERSATPRSAPSERTVNERSDGERAASERSPSQPAEPPVAAAPDAPSPAAAEPSTAQGPAGTAAPRSWLSQGSGASREAGSEESSGNRTGLTIGAVLLLLGLAAAAIVLRYKRQTLSPLGPSESRLTVLSSSRVGPKAFAVTAHVNGRVLLLGVTDHTVTNLGWLDPREAQPAALGERPEREAGSDDDDLPEDYPGSALRASRVPPAFASSSNLKRFQEVLRGAEESRAELPLRPSYHPSPMDAASLIAAQTSDVVAAGPAKAKPSPVSIRRKRRGQASIPPRDSRPAAAPSSQKPADPSLEGQVAGLRGLRNGG
jgi:flagellar biogenesis protein FliO